MYIGGIAPVVPYGPRKENLPATNARSAERPSYETIDTALNIASTYIVDLQEKKTELGLQNLLLSKENEFLRAQAAMIGYSQPPKHGEVLDIVSTEEDFVPVMTAGDADFDNQDDGDNFAA